MKALIFATAIGLLLTGCVQPEFNRSNKGIAFVDGRPYAIPYGSTYGYPFNKNEPQLLRDFRNAGVDCRIGDTFWVEASYKDELRKALTAKDYQTHFAIISKAAAAGKAGCAHPLSRQEYEYMLHKENQEAAYRNAAAAAEANAAAINAAVTSINLHNTVNSL